MNNCETDISGDCPVRRPVWPGLEIKAELRAWNHHKLQSPLCVMAPDAQFSADLKDVQDPVPACRRPDMLWL